MLWLFNKVPPKLINKINKLAQVAFFNFLWSNIGNIKKSIKIKDFLN